MNIGAPSDSTLKSGKSCKLILSVIGCPRDNSKGTLLYRKVGIVTTAVVWRKEAGCGVS